VAVHLHPLTDGRVTEVTKRPHNRTGGNNGLTLQDNRCTNGDILCNLNAVVHNHGTRLHKIYASSGMGFNDSSL
jgi:hypothetical protein